MFLKEIFEFQPFLNQTIHNFNKINSRNPYRSIEQEKSTIWAKSELPNPSGRPKNAQNTFATPVDLPRSSPKFIKSIKLKDLSPGTHLTRKSVQRIYRKLKSRASETVWASSYGQITVLEPELWILWVGFC